MSQPDFYAILDECLARQGQGETLESCLANYPEQATELNPVLVISAGLYQLPRLEPAPDTVARGYETMMAAVAAQERPSWLAAMLLPAAKFWSSLKPRQAGGPALVVRLAVILLAIMIVSSAFVITASADSLPGDVLYPVKRSWESTRLALSLSEPSRQALAIEFAETRRDEVEAILTLRRPAIVEFQGRLLSISDDAWLVDGLAVAAGDDTEVIGAIVVGQQVYVLAQARPDGQLVALRIVAGEADSPDTDVPIEESLPTREVRPTPEPTITPEPTDKPTRQPAGEATATRESEPTLPAGPTRDVKPTTEPTATRRPETNVAPTDGRTATPDDRPTETLSNSPTDTAKPTDEPTRDPKPTSEPTVSLEPTASSQPTSKADSVPTATHEARLSPTKPSDSGGNSDRPQNN